MTNDEAFHALMKRINPAYCETDDTQFTRHMRQAWQAAKEEGKSEPVAWMDNLGNCGKRKSKYAVAPLYLAPPHDAWMDKAAEYAFKLEIARKALEKLSYVEGNGVARVALEKIGEGK